MTAHGYYCNNLNHRIIGTMTVDDAKSVIIQIVNQAAPETHQTALLLKLEFSAFTKHKKQI